MTLFSELLKKLCVVFMIFISESKLWLYRRLLKDSSAIPNTFFLCNSAGYLKGYPRKLLLFNHDLTGNLPFSTIAS